MRSFSNSMVTDFTSPHKKNIKNETGYSNSTLDTFKPEFFEDLPGDSQEICKKMVDICFNTFEDTNGDLSTKFLHNQIHDESFFEEQPFKTCFHEMTEIGQICSQLISKEKYEYEAYMEKETFDPIFDDLELISEYKSIKESDNGSLIIEHDNESKTHRNKIIFFLNKII